MTEQHRNARAIALWSLAYLVAYLLGLAFTDPVRHVSTIWPASGVALAALLSLPRRRWPVALAAFGAIAFAANVVLTRDVALSAGFVVPNVAEGALGAWAVTTLCRRPITFTRVDEVLAVAVAAALVNAVTASIGAAIPWLVHDAPFWDSYRTWWTSNALGTMLVAPLLVVWTTEPPAPAPDRRLEKIAFAFAWCAAGWIATGSSAIKGPLAPHPYMLVCLLPWAALRLGMRTVTTAMTVLGTLVIGSFVSGRIHRDFQTTSLADGTMQAQLFVALATLTALLLGASRAEADAARRAADRSTEHLALALDSANMGAWEWDVKRDRVIWSDGVARAFDLAPEAFDGTYRSYLALIHPDDRQHANEVISHALETGAECTFDHRVIATDGAIRWLHARGRVHRDDHGKPLRMSGTVTDITQQRQVEEHLRESQKMEAIGQLAGGVAHDFNNILSAILTQAEVARMRLGRLPAERELFDEIVVAAERGASLTKQLLAFARRQVLEPKPVDLGTVVSDHATMLRRLVGEQVRVRVQLSPAPLVARADVGMVGQVLMNLAVNARDAMPGGGDLTITTEEIVLDVETATVSGEAPPGIYRVLRVADTGTGIPPENLRRVFEPFFTTKPAGKGTGLGLATVFGIVKLHGGFLRMESEVGRGTTFEILLPPTDAPLVSASPAPPARDAAGPATILLVEDDPSVRKTTRMLLEMSGHEVIDAKSGAEALRAWDEHGAKIGLLFTDVTLPEGMRGQDLAAELRKRKADLKVILTSGYSADLAGRELEPGDRFLMKPTPPEALLEAVERTLAHG